VTTKKQVRNRIGKAENLTNAGKGRPKGAVNKTTALLKDAILQAAEAAGAKLVVDKSGKATGGMVDYLTKQAEDNPGPFLTLLGKVLPLQINGGEDEHGLPKAIEIRYISAKDRLAEISHQAGRVPMLNVEYDDHQ
jgi:hypothetical protein